MDLITILLFPLRLIIWWPLVFLTDTLLFLLSPAIEITKYLFSWVQSTGSFIKSLHPLYTYLGSAALIGIVSGTVLFFLSRWLATLLGLNEAEGDEGSEDDEADGSGAGSSDSPTVKVKVEDSSSDVDLQWYEHTPGKRKKTSGLLSQTIHEESDGS